MMKAIPDDIPRTSIQSSLMFDLLGSCLMDMAKEETISESLVDSFNLPIYASSAKEMKEIIERNGCFSIEILETTHPLSEAIVKLDPRVFAAHIRAGLSGIISKHFGNKIIDELFDRLDKKAEENSYLLNNPSYTPNQLFIVLIRK
ncbi:SAM dependent carboxyl methyltransferase [Corchorus olitorius]|uniref:SAM dependent carboxyl methyltransferase n=1 Tax=Corchorus olitorius TaxID=93759 RepID=A0A1R3HQ30_9ROSI|nr:SAM dependent carboxyl methyltransferase [Corchorus olitorius]